MYGRRVADVDGNPMEILVFEPEGEGPFPGIVVTQHLPVAHAGLETDPFQIDVGEKLARAGYVAAIPYMFHWWEKDVDIDVKRAEWRDDRAVADMNTAHDLLVNFEDVAVDPARIGIMGHCWGGRMAWLGACHNPAFRVCGVFYGGRIKVGMGEGAPPPMELASNMNCEVLGIFGNDDENPSPADVDDLDAALTAAGIAHEFHRYDKAGHGFQDFTNEDRHRPEQTADAWAKFFAFFDARLKG